MAMRVGDLARRTGVGVSTLRAWENRYSFLKPVRSPAGHRLYDEADVERVHAVLRLVGEGLTLGGAITRVASTGAGAQPPREAEALLYAQILQAVGQGVWVIGHVQTRFVNRRMAEIMGCSVEELLALPVLSIFNPDQLPAVKERDEDARAGKRLHFRTELRRADGSTFLADVHATPLFNQAGRYEASVALVSDVTAHHESATQGRLRATVLEAIGEAVTASTPDGTVVYVNAAAEQLFGWRAADVIGRNGLELIASSDAHDESQRIHDLLVGGTRYAGQIEMVRADGTRFIGHATSAPVLDEDGELVALVAVITDRTERNRQEHVLRTRELQMETLALLGTQALRQHGEPRAGAALVLTEAVEAARRVLGADEVLVLDVVSEADKLCVVAGSPTAAQGLMVPSGSRSFAGYVVLARKAVVMADAAQERRFDIRASPAPEQLGSAIGAPVFAPDGIVGVLTATHRAAHQFDHGDAQFLQGMANIIGTALLS
jgi:PAS domain S-box-containing protein